MSTIKFLDDGLITKIAAGEVIERPASVVKELVENSIDAQSTQIKVHIEDCGKKLIRVSDNGSGMAEDDAKRSILRHTTSKISEIDDLFSLQTLGFRGEALATIAAVSQLSMITRVNSSIEGFNMVVEGGLVVSSGVIAAQIGTSIEVRNLFFNTPARKKFLKSDAVELRHIIDVVTNYALLNPQIAFTLTHEKHTLLDAPITTDARNNVASIYSVSVAKDLLGLDFESDGVKVSGFIGKPEQARNDKNQQVLFVNGRAVRNYDISKTVYDGYHSLLFHGKHPLFILSIKLNPGKVDVNIHPQKQEIKIEQKEVVSKIVFDAVKKTLQQNNLIPVVDFDFEEQMILPTKVRKPVRYAFEKSKQEILEVKDSSPYEIVYSEELEEENSEQESVANENEQEPLESREGIPKLPEMKLFGQIHKTFFVAETRAGVFFIDQHAAHERVLYETFMQQLMRHDVEVQNLLKGEVFELTAIDNLLANEHKELFHKFGFGLEPFGENTMVLKTLPAIFGRLQPKEIFKEFLAQIEQGKNTLESIKEVIITRMACRAAVMAGDELTNSRMEEILAQLERADHPFTCPHGRPTIIKISSDELEKKFKRK